MCKCTPSIRTPFCGKLNCEWPGKKPPGTRMMITDEYRALNTELHASSPKYGTSGHRWAEVVMQLAADFKAYTVLDYGCGKSTLLKALPPLAERPIRFEQYDPCIPGLDEPPEPADLVVCTDVLEHIEPDCLEAVLDDLARLTIKAVFLEIATRPAVKTLADGRNAHLIVEQPAWWLPKLDKRWKRVEATPAKGSLVYLGAAKP